MGVGMCLYVQLVRTKDKQCKSAIILQCYHPHWSDFCCRPRLTQPYNHIIYPGVAKIYLVFFWKCLLYLLILLFLTVKLFGNIFFTIGSPIILGLPALNIFTKFDRVTPYGGAKYRWCIKITRFSYQITYQITYQTRPPQGKLAQPQESHRLK